MPKEFVDQLLNKLFGSSKKDEPQEAPVISEKLIRKPDYLDRYLEWLDSNRYAAVLLRLKSLHAEADRENVEHFHIYRSPQANGFFFDENTGVNQEEFSFLLDHFRDATLDEGYRLYTSDTKLTEKSNSVQKIERHYLKPAPAKEMSLPMNQRYGNVLMEYVSYNERPAYLKVMVSCYSDRNFTEALPYAQIAKKLFSPINPDR